MHKTDIIFAAVITGLLALPVGCTAYAQSETRTIYETGHTFSGYPAVWEREVDRFGAKSTGKLVGYYGGGNPGVIGFGCEGAEAPIIAVEESDLPLCKRVEPIANRRLMLETR
jgi:hypothetical protein